MCRLSVAALCPPSCGRRCLWAASLWLLTASLSRLCYIEQDCFFLTKKLRILPLPRSAEGERESDGKFVFQTSGEGTRSWNRAYVDGWRRPRFFLLPKPGPAAPGEAGGVTDQATAAGVLK